MAKATDEAGEEGDADVNEDTLLSVLDGGVKSISMMELRNNIGSVIQQVQLGRVFVLTKAGKQVAVLARPPGRELLTLVNERGEVSYDL